VTTDEAPGRDHRTEGTLLDANASRGQPITDGDGVRLITELGDPSMGARSSGPVLGVCQPRRPSAAGDPARRAAFATFEQAVDADGVLSARERAKRADNLWRAYLRQMALKSAKARRLRAQLVQLKQQAGADARPGSMPAPWAVMVAHDENNKEPPPARRRPPKAATNSTTKIPTPGTPVPATRRAL
jgi:hypothetical protein